VLRDGDDPRAHTAGRRHHRRAGAAPKLRHGDTDATVAVRNTPPPAGPLPARSQGRRGLVGLRERVRLAGGSLSAARLPDGGFEVVARLPYAAGLVASPDSPLPSGAPSTDCRYYRSHGDFFRAADTYCLCFAGGRLVAKDVIPVR
jgi:hypothetical protein